MKKLILNFLISLLVLIGFSPELFAQTTYYSWRYRTHATDCTAITDGKAQDLCKQLSNGKIYVCLPSSGDCNTPGEWVLVTGDTVAWGNLTGTLSNQTDLQTALNAKQDTLTNSAGLAAALSDETGTGAAVLANTPTLITPVIGAATGTSLMTTGNIGIGTPTAGQKLVVNGSAQIGSTSSQGTITNSAGLAIDSNADSTNDVVFSSGDTKIGTGTFNNTSGSGDLYVAGNLEVDGTIYGDGSGLTGVASNVWTDGGTTLYNTTTSDNVGIGTTDAPDKLTVVGAARITGSGDSYFNVTSGNFGVGTFEPQAKFHIFGTMKTTGSGDSYFGVTSGNVGVGTFAPLNKLHIVGTAQMTGFKLTTSPVSGYVLTSDGNGVGTWQAATGGGAGGGWTDGGANVYTSTTTDLVGIGTTTPTAMLNVVKSSTNDLLKVSSAAGAGGDYFIINSAGNVGIGTISALNRKLTVGSTGLAVLGSSDSYFNMTAGNVGIGTSTPNAELVVSSTAANDLFKIEDSGPGDTTPFVINSDGNVGIGTPSPANALEVNGSGVFNGTGDTLLNPTTGNVGIGTPTPGSKLDIFSGTVRLVGIGTTTAGTAACFTAAGKIGYCTGSWTGTICSTCTAP